MYQINIHQAKTQLSKLVDEAAQGEEIIIAKAGKPIARLVPLATNECKPRKPGGMKGFVYYGTTRPSSQKQVNETAH